MTITLEFKPFNIYYFESTDWLAYTTKAEQKLLLYSYLCRCSYQPFKLLSWYCIWESRFQSFLMHGISTALLERIKVTNDGYSGKEECWTEGNGDRLWERAVNVIIRKVFIVTHLFLYAFYKVTLSLVILFWGTSKIKLPFTVEKCIYYVNIMSSCDILFWLLEWWANRRVV